MARFADTSDAEIHQLLEDRNRKNTTNLTSASVKITREYLEDKATDNFMEDLESDSNKNLN
jgi:hypothetical protein